MKNVIDAETWDRLKALALDARDLAYAPYSEFQVGAALLTESGEFFSGCNIENATYGATVCAERTALGNAIAAGNQAFQAICIATAADEPVAPCGICRQVIAEFAEDLPILLITTEGEEEMVTLEQLLPHVFRASNFEGQAPSR